MNKTFILQLLLLVQFLFFPLQKGFAQDLETKDQSSGEDLFDALEKSYEGFFEDREAKLESLWDRLEAEEEARWKRLEQDVLQKWDIYHPTTNTVWVDYSKKRDAVSRVDFEAGKVIVEALVPQSTPALKEEAIKLIAVKLDEMNQEKAGDGKPVLKDMFSKETKAVIRKLKGKDNLNVVKKNPLPLKSPLLKEKKHKYRNVKDIPAISVSEPFKGKDGVVRVKVKMELEFVPGHVKRRALRYIDLVREYSKKNGMEEALVLAVMHTESFFNPKARSHIPAYGLMQLVPRWAAKEAYQQLYGKEKVLSSTYLYKPKNNIELGVTYLSRLHNVYFKGITDLDSRRFISVAAYNWGPTAMRRKIVSKEDINGMRPDEVFDLLQKRLPKETKDYLKRIEKRRKMYSG